MIKQGKAGYIVDEVILHTLDVPTGWHEGRSAESVLLSVREWHVARGWRKEGYHRIIIPNGQMAIGRSLYEIGAGVEGHNRGKIHIALCNVNKVDRIGQFKDFYTKEQRIALRDYLLELEELTGPLRVSGHNDYANRLCPGFRVRTDDWL